MPSNKQTENRTEGTSETATQEQNPMQQLEQSIETLKAERQRHLDRIAEIDSYFDRYGINPNKQNSGKRESGRGRPRKASSSKASSEDKGRKKKHNKSAPQFLLDTLRNRKNKSATTEELNKLFQESRKTGYHVSVVIKQLEKSGYVRKTSIDGSRSKRVELVEG